ncbi:hypothetical protein CDV31_015819 [Fusarium ambrosium]|uniref:Clr5 domain-containing protein n=1 Tax=Fusarium ambrosium TaxID=131363 RepID=A0A428SIW7_9HYPO|nr:hypothetical protein CDV31_015819 [Fusarium ambrosium]
MSRAPRIPNAQWEKHKPAIRNLYISQEKKLEDVIQLMADDHGFQPTKAQYVRKLESWGFKKNSSKEKWEHAAAVVRKRKAEGKETELQMNGKVISTKRLRKEFGRYANLPSFLAAPPIDPDHDLEGVVARTPPCSLSSGFIMPNYLPWFQFQDYLASIIIPRSPPVSNPGWPVSQRTPSQSLTLPESSLPKQTWTGILEAKGSYSQFSELLSRHSVAMSGRPGDDTHVQLQHLSEAQPFLQVVQRVIYLSSNNLLSDKQTDNFLEWVTESGNIWAFKEIINRKESTCQAFACQLLLNAIRLRNEELVSAILTRDARPENDNALPEDAIQTAVCSGNSGIVQLLLDHLTAVNTSDSSRQVGQYLNSENTGRYEQFEDAFPLSSAIRYGDITMVRSLLDAGADVNYMASSTTSALHVAVEEECLEMVEILLQAGADVNIPLGEGYRESGAISYVYGVPQSLLQVAARYGMNEIVQRLLQEGADIDGTWFTSIEMFEEHAAVKSGNQDLVQLFIAEGGHVNAKPAAYLGITCLQAAVSRGHVGVTGMLLKAGAFVNQIERKLTPLCLAISRQSHQLFALLMKCGADPDPPGVRYTPLGMAVAKKDLEMVSILLIAGADPNRFSTPSSLFGVEPPLVTALRACGHTFSIVQVLVNHGADVNNLFLRSYHPIMLAPQLHDYDEAKNTIQLLLDAGADVRLLSRNMNLVDLGDSQWELMRMLLDRGADINAPISSQGTALQLAVEKGHIDIAQELILRGADINAPGYPEKGRTALQLAVEQDNIHIARKLILCGADVNAPPASKAGATALQFAAMKGNIEMAILLLENQADINAGRALYKGRTALEGAAEYGRLDMVYLLLENDRDPETIEERCEEAAMFAEEQEHFEIARILQEWRRP